MTTEVDTLGRPIGITDLPPIRLRLIKGWYSEGKLPSRFAPFFKFRPFIQYQAQQTKPGWADVTFEQANTIETWISRHNKLQDNLVEYDLLEDEINGPGTEPERAVELLTRRRKLASRIRRLYLELRNSSAIFGL